jgi:hypothetical protein
MRAYIASKIQQCDVIIAEHEESIKKLKADKVRYEAEDVGVIHERADSIKQLGAALVARKKAQEALGKKLLEKNEGDLDKSRSCFLLSGRANHSRQMNGKDGGHGRNSWNQ